MKIVVLGIRGLLNVQGGVETHSEHLYPELVKKDCEVIVLTRKPYVDSTINFYQGVRLISLYCPKNKFLEAFYHTFSGIFAAKKLKPDILHIHAIGPSLFIPLAKLFGLKVVMTNHGPDYERKKWNWFAKIILRVGEMWGSKAADQIICISRPIADEIEKKYNKKPNIIPNGVVMPEIAKSYNALKLYGLEEGRYILAVGRFVPEKGFHDLMEAYKRLQNKTWKLVIVGNADHEDKYSRKLKEIAKEVPGVVLAGFLTGLPLRELYSHAGLFVLPSYYEGLPIVLLEAMSYRLSCVVSDIPANKEVNLPADRFFKAGDIKQLAEKMNEFISKPISTEEKSREILLISEKYNWGKIADQTLEVYKLVSSF